MPYSMSMSFFFGGSRRDTLSHKIRMREIGAVAKQWDHPMKGLFQYATQIGEDRDILSLSKKIREKYCLSILTLALMDETGSDWWLSIPDTDPPDGFVGTFAESRDGYVGLMREVEVVEHRLDSTDLVETIKRKMLKKAYGTNTILACLVLTPDVYDFENLSRELMNVESHLDHIFLVFTGALYKDVKDKNLDLESTYSVIQLKPRFETHSFSFKPYMADFNERYKKGQESRLIEGDNMYYGTTNKSVVS